MNVNYVKKAADFASLKHRGQKRKDGKDYFTHVEAVAYIVCMDWFTLIPREAQDNWNEHKDHVVAAAYLHDIMEDCGVTRQQLLDEGFSTMTVEIVEALTKRQGETYFDFIMRCNESHAFRTGIVAVKLADLQHNMSDLKEGAKKDKYRFAHYILNYFNPKLQVKDDIHSIARQIYYARIAMNEGLVKQGLDKLDNYFRDENLN